MTLGEDQHPCPYKLGGLEVIKIVMADQNWERSPTRGDPSMYIYMEDR